MTTGHECLNYHQGYRRSHQVGVQVGIRSSSKVESTQRSLIVVVPLPVCLCPTPTIDPAKKRLFSSSGECVLSCFTFTWQLHFRSGVRCFAGLNATLFATWISFQLLVDSTLLLM